MFTDGRGLFVGPARKPVKYKVDLGHQKADVMQLKLLLARRDHVRTGIAAADFSRIRNAALGRFTVDRLMSVID